MNKKKIIIKWCDALEKWFAAREDYKNPTESCFAYGEFPAMALNELIREEAIIESEQTKMGL